MCNRLGLKKYHQNLLMYFPEITLTDAKRIRNANIKAAYGLNVFRYCIGLDNRTRYVKKKHPLMLKLEKYINRSI